MKFERSSGILLHPTSLPGPLGIGDLGRSAYDFVEFLKRANQSLWQILPLGPTGYGNSPYMSLSSFAGNPLLISPEELVREGFLEEGDLESNPGFDEDSVDYNRVKIWKLPLLDRAARRLIERSKDVRKSEFESFCAAQRDWLDDYAVFTVARRRDGPGWNTEWESDLARHGSETLARYHREFRDDIELQKALQYLFYRQWDRLRAYAGERGIRIIGDLPIYVAYESVDVWANRELFQLDEEGIPTAVAGVPPDYFSQDGQLWGNPLYDWNVLADRQYDWWIARVKATLRNVDFLRIDHFRGFESYWSVPYGKKTAAEGHWIEGPGADFFEVLSRELGELPIIAEDLGVITPEVEKLRDRFNLPGMKVLQFAFDEKTNVGFDVANPFLPHNHIAHSVVYTGTHDNDTTRGWYEKRTPREKDCIRRYFDRPDDDIVWDFIRAAMSSVSEMAIVPLQDPLDLDSAARMNTPSVAEGNWRWRFQSDALDDWIVGRLAEMSRLYGRNFKRSEYEQ